MIYFVDQSADRAYAMQVYEQLQQRMQMQLVEAEDLEGEEASSLKGTLHLLMDAEGLKLTDGNLVLLGDFTQSRKRLTTNNLRSEMLVKATKIKGVASPLVLDATAGMGEDSILLAAAGARVWLYEYDPIIAALLGDAMHRASKIPELEPIVSRMELHSEDSIEAMRQMAFDCNANAAQKVDVVVLDPMFPERNKSALIKKKFQLLQQLERPCSEEEELLSAAIAIHPRKIVIKRPKKGPYLAGKKPDYAIEGKAIRYDCMVLTYDI